MNTPAHLILGAAVFGRPDRQRVTWAALAGSFVPDASLYAMSAVAILALGIPAETVFRELYYSPTWQQVFAVDNSFVLWGAALGVAIWMRSMAASAFCGAALLHLAADFPLHNHDARMHFWPLTDWKFHSPVSYWDSSRGANLIGAAETAMVLALAALLVLRYDKWLARLGFSLLASAQLAPALIWGLVF